MGLFQDIDLGFVDCCLYRTLAWQSLIKAVFEDEVKRLVNLAKRRVTTRPKNRLPENRRNVQLNESQKLDAISQEHLDVDFFFNDVKYVDSNKQPGKLSSTVDRLKCQFFIR